MDEENNSEYLKDDFLLSSLQEKFFDEQPKEENKNE